MKLHSPAAKDLTLVAEDLEENVMGCNVVLWTNGHVVATATAQPMKKRSVSKNTATPQTGTPRKEDEVEAEVGATHPIHPTPYCLYQIWIREVY